MWRAGPSVSAKIVAQKPAGSLSCASLPAGQAGAAAPWALAVAVVSVAFFSPLEHAATSEAIPTKETSFVSRVVRMLGSRSSGGAGRGGRAGATAGATSARMMRTEEGSTGIASLLYMHAPPARRSLGDEIARVARMRDQRMLWPRWIFLRALGLIFFSAFYSLAFQIRGLIGERGILPASDYLHEIARAGPGLIHFWYAPTLLWLGAGDQALMLVVWAGMVVSLMLAANIAPRISVFACTMLFLSCIGVLQEFSSYQSDGMLLEAG